MAGEQRQSADSSVRVIPGEVRVSSIFKVLEHLNCVVWNIDLHTKYAEVVCCSGNNKLFLGATKHTLRPDESRKGELTQIILPERDDEGGHWYLSFDGPGRYTVTAIQWQWASGSTAEAAWVEEDDEGDQSGSTEVTP